MTPIPKDIIKHKVSQGIHRGLFIGLAFGLTLSLLFSLTIFQAVSDTLLPVSDWERALRKIGEHTCEKNKGLRNITVEEVKDKYSFNCRDGLSLRDIVVRIK